MEQQRQRAIDLLLPPKWASIILAAYAGCAFSLAAVTGIISNGCRDYANHYREAAIHSIQMERQNEGVARFEKALQLERKMVREGLSSFVALNIGAACVGGAFRYGEN